VVRVLVVATRAVAERTRARGILLAAAAAVRRLRQMQAAFGSTREARAGLAVPDLDLARALARRRKAAARLTGYQFTAPVPTRHWVLALENRGTLERVLGRPARRCPDRGSAEEEAAQA
jgi:hypothetical protein